MPLSLMSNWEYKVISSGKGGFASPALMEKFLNDLGQENWEILSFHQPADNALAFHGLARRSTQRTPRSSPSCPGGSANTIVITAFEALPTGGRPTPS